MGSYREINSLILASAKTPKLKEKTKAIFTKNFKYHEELIQLNRNELAPCTPTGKRIN